jgi:hypothetical protein
MALLAPRLNLDLDLLAIYIVYRINPVIHALLHVVILLPLEGMSALPNHCISSDEVPLLGKANAFFGKHLYLAIALLPRSSILSPFSIEAANKMIGGDDAVAWDEWCKRVMAQSGANCIQVLR